MFEISDVVQFQLALQHFIRSADNGIKSKGILIYVVYDFYLNLSNCSYNAVY